MRRFIVCPSHRKQPREKTDRVIRKSLLFIMLLFLLLWRCTEHVQVTVWQKKRGLAANELKHCSSNKTRENCSHAFVL